MSTAKIEIEIPSLINFVRTKNGDTYSIHMLTDVEVKSLCLQWSKAMLIHARKKRAALKSKPKGEA